MPLCQHAAASRTRSHGSVQLRSRECGQAQGRHLSHLSTTFVGLALQLISALLLLREPITRPLQTGPLVSRHHLTDGHNHVQTEHDTMKTRPPQAHFLLPCDGPVSRLTDNIVAPTRGTQRRSSRNPVDVARRMVRIVMNFSQVRSCLERARYLPRDHHVPARRRPGCRALAL